MSKERGKHLGTKGSQGKGLKLGHGEDEPDSVESPIRRIEVQPTYKLIVGLITISLRGIRCPKLVSSIRDLTHSGGFKLV